MVCQGIWDVTNWLKRSYTRSETVPSFRHIFGRAYVWNIPSQTKPSRRFRTGDRPPCWSSPYIGVGQTFALGGCFGAEDRGHSLGTGVCPVWPQFGVQLYLIPIAGQTLFLPQFGVQPPLGSASFETDIFGCGDLDVLAQGVLPAILWLLG